MDHRWQAPTPPGWFPDPGGSPSLRYWDGSSWTAQLAAPAAPFTYPPGSPPVATISTPYPTLPLQVAITALIVTAVSLTASRFLVQWLVEYRWPIAVYSGIAAVVGYGPLVACCVVCVRRWGTGSLRNDLGLQFRPVDLGWGPLTWVAAFIGQIVVSVVIIATKIPFESNTKGVSAHSGDRAYIIAFGVLAVVCAPLVEELVFRGLVLRGFSSAMPAWLAVGLQGILFGAAHTDPVRGVKNIGLVIALSVVGIVFGAAARMLRRLAPTMIAHALVNTLALVVLLTR